MAHALPRVAVPGRPDARAARRTPHSSPVCAVGPRPAQLSGTRARRQRVVTGRIILAIPRHPMRPRARPRHATVAMRRARFRDRPIPRPVATALHVTVRAQRAMLIQKAPERA